MKVKKLNLIIIFLSLIGIIGYVGFADFKEMASIIHRVNFAWILGTLLLMVVYWFLETLSLYLVVKTGVPFGVASSCLLTKFIIYQVVLTLYSLVVLCMKFGEFLAEVNGFTYMVMIGFIVNIAVVLALLSIGCLKK